MSDVGTETGLKDDLTQAEIDAYWRGHTPWYSVWIPVAILVALWCWLVWTVITTWMRWLGV